ncbi:SMC family ATPase [Diaminobutyricimonas sp. TR449]|uniref:AAA family ATPase n=1 Tax=Diaminobutyricimonas sp. TR449 TaxID=2708076 RepID=UPI0014243107|nr:SMC family ATPase [Diaminobutyricimonas sp. TR449]
MRINRLELAGFGPYKQAQTVDFDSYADDGIFLISGKTGAGKSSILDAICFALYNSVPRYDGTQTQLRSHHCEIDDPSYVELDFTVGDQRYRVRRTPEYERPKARGTGTTTQKADADLFIWRNEDWEGIASRPVDVGNELARIVALSKDQFLQVILLAQNRFQQFLLAKNDERGALLRTLFGTERFERYETAIVERAKALDAQLGSAIDELHRDRQRASDLLVVTGSVETSVAAAGTIDTSSAALTDGSAALAFDTDAVPELDWFTVALAALTEVLERATADAERAREHAEAAASAHQALVTTQQRQTRRDLARAKVTALDAEATDVDSSRVALQAAVRAAAVWPHVTARREAAVAFEAAQADESTARGVYSGFGDQATDAATLTAVTDELTRTLGALDEVLREEAGLPALDTTLAELGTKVAALDESLAAAATRAIDLPVRLTQIGDALTTAKVEAGRQADASANVDRLSKARAAASDAADLEPKVTAAQTRELEAVKAHTAASGRVEELLTTRLRGAAGELAAQLQAGEPCAVCGSTEHPRPAEPSEDSVSDADIDAAREQLDAARAIMDTARAEAKELADKLTDARARAEQRTVEAIDELLVAARVVLATSTEAATEATRLETEQATVRAELEALEVEQQTLHAERDRVETERATTLALRSELAERVERQRADYETVASRAAALHKHLEAARELERAIDDRVARTSALETATTALQAQLEEHDFADEHAVDSARLEPAERAALEQRIREHEQGIATARATLAEPELADLPNELVSTDAAAEQLAAAQKAHADTVAVLGSVRERHGQLERLVGDVQGRLEASAALREEYEQVRSLADAVQGGKTNTKRMRLETYVLAAQLEEIVAAANGRLRTMTSGRYELQHDDSVQYRNTRSGLGLAILDQHTGRARATHSLSGGETFLASLALALGLAEVVTNQAGGITLDTLFVDEGFGSLDGETLEIAMSTLDSLRAGGRTIGLISHVEAMKEQIPAKLRIRVTDAGWSEIACQTGP